MKTPLAWRNVWQNKARSVIALAGISLSILLIFMQLGFYAATRTSATNVYAALDFDLLALSPHYVFLARAPLFPRTRLAQALAVEGVASVQPIWLGLGEWRNIESRKRWNILSLGVEPSARPFLDQTLNDRLPVLNERDTILSDALSRPEHGPLQPDVLSEVQGRRVRVVGRYEIGAGFVAGATLITGHETFFRIFPETQPGMISAGLIKLRPGFSAENAAREINRLIAPSAVVRTRAELFQAEQHFWLKVKPIGIIFTSGMLIAFIAGAAILYQVLATEVQNRLREYATLKALGYGDRFIYGAVVRQALIFSMLGFVPAFAFSLLLYHLLRTRALVPVTMEVSRAGGVLLLTALMCLGATFFAVRKLRAADPADLF